MRVIALDYRKAFDLIDHNILLTKLCSFDINSHIVNWIHNFSSDRSQRVKLSNDCFSEWKSVPAGVPQGTKLGPWLFLIMIEDLEIPSSDGTVKFVDDTTAYEIIPRGKTSSAQKLVDEVTTWSSTKFQLHPKKYKEMRISFSRSLPKYDNLLVDTDTVEIVDSLKLLGMTISKDLKWNTHIYFINISVI